MRIQVGGVRLYFDVDGAGFVPNGTVMREKPTLLLLHGGPGFDHSILKPWFDEFRDVTQLVYLDHRGNGQSDRSSPEHLDLAQWGDDVRAFCDALEIRDPIVFGVSFGGFVAQSYATRHPGHARGLVLCNTAARVLPERVLDTFERLGGPAARATASAYFDMPSADGLAAYASVCTPLYNRTPQDPDAMARSLPRANLELINSFFVNEWRKFNFLPQLAKVRCPTLVLAGEDDPITPPADSEDIVAALPANLVRFERFPKCGHPVYQDDPKRFSRVMREFFAAVGAQ